MAFLGPGLVQPIGTTWAYATRPVQGQILAREKGIFSPEFKEFDMETKPWYSTVSDAATSIANAIGAGAKAYNAVTGTTQRSSGGSVMDAVNSFFSGIGKTVQGAAAAAQGAVGQFGEKLGGGIPVKASLDPLTIALVLGAVLVIVFAIKR